MPEALGNCCFTLDSIFEEMTFSVVMALPPSSIPTAGITIRITDRRLI
jgi:hypothetical protein